MTSIGQSAFLKCSSLSSITLPESLTSIEGFAFAECTSLSSIFINAATPPTVGILGTDLGCNKNTSVYVPEELVEAYKAADGWNAHNILSQSFETEGIKYKITSSTTHEVAVTGGDDKAQIVIPDKVNYGGIEYTVTSIGSNAFKECTLLSSITIPQSVTSIGEWAFALCTSLTSITLPKGITSIGQGAIGGCTALTSITLPEGLTTIDYGTFWGCTSLSSVTLPKGLTRIGNYAFKECTSLSSITLPEGLTNVPHYAAFEGCSALKSINVVSDNPTFSSIDGILFSKDGTSLIYFPEGRPETSYIVPDHVTDIHDNAFYNNPTLSYITIPEGVTSIGYSAFWKCTLLSSVTLPESLTSIGYLTFKECKSLSSIFINATTPPIEDFGFGLGGNKNTSLYVPDNSVEAYSTAHGWNEFTVLGQSSAKQFEIDGIKYKVTSFTTHEVAVTGGDDKTQIVIPNKVNYAGIEYTVTSIEYWAFSNCRLLSSISLPQGLRSIGNYAFSYSPYLSSIYLPATVTEIGTGVFNGCSSLESINVASSNQNYLSIDGVLFTKDKKSLICFPERKYAQSYIVPDKVTHINDGAFSDCTSLSAITLPEGLTNIGTNAFKNCAALSSIVSNAVTPPTIKDNSTFTGVNKNIPVYVPNGTVTAYKRATGWKEFTNYQSQATSVRQTELPNGLKMSNGKLDNADGLSIEIFDANGRLVYTGSDTTVSLPSGVYIVRHASSCFKIRF